MSGADSASHADEHQRQAQFAAASVAPSQDPSVPALSSSTNTSTSTDPDHPDQHPSSSSSSSTSSSAAAPKTDGAPPPIDVEQANKEPRFMSSPEMDGHGHPSGGASGGTGTGNGNGEPSNDRNSDARSVAETTARDDADYSPGATNRHPPPNHPSRKSFVVGVSEDRNRKCRRTMEDSHSFAYCFGGVDGQGYFAVFDGHAGKHAAEWCGEWFHEYLLRHLAGSSRTTPVPDLLNSTFHIVDAKLSQLAAEDGTHSGCTAVTAFLRLEHADGTPYAPVGAGVEHESVGRPIGGAKGQGSGAGGPAKVNDLVDGVARDAPQGQGEFEQDAMKAALGDLEQARREREQELNRDGARAHDPARSGPAKRTLYTANVGDARAVLCRGGKAVRLTYDHKGSDAQEAKRITDAGGFVMNNRVNGVLAVTRSLGDSSMKEFVVGSPYTTETTLSDDDDFLIIACDGLWDVCEDQDAVDLVRNVKDPQEASQFLLDHALGNFSTDNLSVLVVRLRP